ncbi:MAG: BMP family ABC transporter substrate-binding protein [Eubacteriales bacterium]|nr:BMP family ABC transporter substrate-binding protein [Eubacteriales bacterium]MDD4323716.1 BMP family ABC transporter substrate-binding protein [Eubacteriales bacterium]MDD4541916.1 BMP family ABC transporter substrate-binding protein [Eubacteriales bacterium]
MNRKKIFALLLALLMMLSVVAACGNGETDDLHKEGKVDKDGKAEIALITDVGTIDDKSFNQGSWEGVVQYAIENDKTFKYYQPTEKSDAAYINSINLAIEGGAKIIVTPGFLFEGPIHTVQDQFPEVYFILIDGYPHKGDYVPDISDNVIGILYAEEESGYLAGYAAVHEGYRDLGFMGGMAVPAVVRFGYGFLQGADDAAAELGLAAGDINVKYTYVGNFDASPENESKAASWFQEGTEVIFACGGSVGTSVMKAAEKADAKVIGVDVDQYAESETVITSAMKNLKKSVNDAIASIYDESWEGGKAVTLDATEGYTMISMENARFEKFKQADYDAIYAKLVAGDIDITKDTDESGAQILEPTEIELDIVTVENIK